MNTLQAQARRTQPSAIDEASFAYSGTTAYRKLLESVQCDPRSLCERDGFAALPTTDKEFYRSHYPQGVVAGGASLSSRRNVLISHSSGTGGDRLTTSTFTFDLARRMSTTTSAHPAVRERLLAARSQRVARYAAPNCSDVECASPTSTVESRTLRDGTLVLPVGHDLLATRESMVDQAIAEIAALQPDWFYTDATHFAFLLREYARRGLEPPRPSAVILTYTLATRAARRQIRAALGPGIPMAEVVSMSELGWVAMECPDGNLHLNGRDFHLELLDPHVLSPVDESEVGELVITSLGDRLLPHVRYRTGDLYRLLPQCTCGNSAPAVRHEGRGAHFLRLPKGGSISPKACDDLIGDDPGVIAYRFQQKSRELIRFTYIPASDAPASTGVELDARIREAVGRDTQVDVIAADYIPSERTGKFISCISTVTD